MKHRRLIACVATLAVATAATVQAAGTPTPPPLAKRAASSAVHAQSMPTVREVDVKIESGQYYNIYASYPNHEQYAFDVVDTATPNYTVTFDSGANLDSQDFALSSYPAAKNRTLKFTLTAWPDLGENCSLSAARRPPDTAHSPRQVARLVYDQRCTISGIGHPGHPYYTYTDVIVSIDKV